MARYLVPSRSGGMTVANWVVAANREHDRQVRAREICSTCGTTFGAPCVLDKRFPSMKVATPSKRHPDCCLSCDADFE